MLTKEEINNAYYSEDAHSFGSKRSLLKHFGKENKHLIEKALEDNDIYTRYRLYRRPKKFSPYYVYRPRQLIQADVINFDNKDLLDFNDGYKYLFTAIDVFTKYAWSFPIKKHDCKTSQQCLVRIVEESKPLKIENFQSDRGSEFKCKEVKNYLAKEKINQYYAISDRKAAVAERFNLTIQMLVYKMMDKSMTRRWIDFIEPAMNIYLHRAHSTIKMSPSEAELPQNHRKLREIFMQKYVKANIRKKSPKFKVSDTVRLWHGKSKFERGYLEKYTGEHFTITKVKDNLPVTRYFLKDYKGNAVPGNFFEWEMIKFNPPDAYNSWIIKERKRGKQKEYLLKYQGWPDEYNEWVKGTQLNKLEGKYKTTK